MLASLTGTIALPISAGPSRGRIEKTKLRLVSETSVVSGWERVDGGFSAKVNDGLGS